MTDILIRGVPEDVANALAELARGAGKDRMTFIRDLLIKAATEPIVKERYAIRFSTDTGLASGMLRRIGDRVERVGVTGLTVEAWQVIAQVEKIMLRNDPGDREDAIHLLKRDFSRVFEVPV
jgi:hypothetical protein